MRGPYNTPPRNPSAHLHPHHLHTTVKMASALASKASTRAFVAARPTRVGIRSSHHQRIPVSVRRWNSLQQPVQLGSLSLACMDHGSDQRCIILHAQYRSCLASVSHELQKLTASGLAAAHCGMHPLHGCVLTQLLFPCTPAPVLPLQASRVVPRAAIEWYGPDRPKFLGELRAISGRSLPCVRRTHAQQLPAHACTSRCQMPLDSTSYGCLHLSVYVRRDLEPACLSTGHNAPLLTQASSCPLYSSHIPISPHRPLQRG
jgi:hypothetical protein